MSVVNVKINESLETTYTVNVYDSDDVTLLTSGVANTLAELIDTMEFLQVSKEEIALAFRIADKNGDNSLFFGISGCFLYSENEGGVH
jgi:hypothetical protein